MAETADSVAGAASAAIAEAPNVGPIKPWAERVATVGSDAWVNLALDLVDPERKLSPFEVGYFFSRARTLGLDPLARQIFPMKFKGGRMEPFVGIHGIRMLAERTGERGSERPFPIYAADGTLTAVRVTVDRIHDGKAREYEFTAQLKEHLPANAHPESSWGKMPTLMLTKVATANAYRAAFPEVLGGLYIAEEAGSE